jgi:sugar lactone lactonase YvrE
MLVPIIAATPASVSQGVTIFARSTGVQGAAGFSPRVVGTVAVPKGGGDLLAMASSSGGQLWVTQSGEPSQRPVVGRLLRIDTSGKISLIRPVGGFPVALADSGPYVWVVNGIGDGKTPEADANTVSQIDPSTGRLLHRYRIGQPNGVAALGDTAWVAASGRGDVTRVVRLEGRNGAVGRETSLIGTADNITAPDIVVGPAAVYLVALIAEPGQPVHDLVYRLDAHSLRVTARQSLPTLGVTSLTYSQGTLFATVHNVEAGGVYRLDGRTLALTKVVTMTPARALATAHGHLWALFNNETVPPRGYLTAFYATGGRVAARPVALPPGDPYLIAVTSERVWVAPVGGGHDLVAVAPS